VIISDVAAGNPIQQGPIITQQNANVIPASTPGIMSTGAFPSGLPGDDPNHRVFRKSRPIVEIGQRAAIKNAAHLSPVAGTSPIARS
jgi:uncharacterized membrane protein YtjA (UPF0391 family)